MHYSPLPLPLPLLSTMTSSNIRSKVKSFDDGDDDEDNFARTKLPQYLAYTVMTTTTTTTKKTTTKTTKATTKSLNVPEISSISKIVEPAAAAAVISNCYMKITNEIAGASASAFASGSSADVSSTSRDKVAMQPIKLLLEPKRACVNTTTKTKTTTSPPTTTTSVTCACCRKHFAIYEVECNENNFTMKQQKNSKIKIHKHWPFFIVLISILEILIFVYDYITMLKKCLEKTANLMTNGVGGIVGVGVGGILRNGNGYFSGNSSGVIITNVDDDFSLLLSTDGVAAADGGVDVDDVVHSDSLLIYRPDRRFQIWRFVSYMLLHANCFHLGFNVFTQLLFGVPLELLHGAMRVAVIYFGGVFAGSLGSSVVNSTAYLMGASGGVYALIAAQLANILINFEHLNYARLHLGVLSLFVLSDFAYNLYLKYFAHLAPLSSQQQQAQHEYFPGVSYVAHLSGSLAGFTLGLLILKYVDGIKSMKSNLLQWFALSLCVSFIIFTIGFNLINTIAAQSFEEKSEILTNNFIKNLGLS